MLTTQEHLNLQIRDKAVEIAKLLMRRPITEEIALQVDAIEGLDHLDITDGEWVGFDKLDAGGQEYMGGEEHGWIEAILVSLLTVWALENDTGRVYPGDTNFIIDGKPGQIHIRRKPDVAFVIKARVQKTQGYYVGAPDIAIEIMSPSDRIADINKKTNEYLRFGVQQVWQVSPQAQQITIHFADKTSKTYDKDDTLIGEDVIEGFELHVNKLFEA